MMSNYEYEIASKKARWLMRDVIDIRTLSTEELKNIRSVIADQLNLVIEEIGIRYKSSQQITIVYNHN